MTAHHKRSVKRKKAQRKQREDKQKEDQPNSLSMEYRAFDLRHVWKEKFPCYAFEDVDGRKAYIPMQPRGTACDSFLQQFDCEEQLAEWVFGVVKFRPLQLNLECCEGSEEVRDALLRQFHRWPETKIAQAVERCKTLSQQGEQECQEQVQLYLQELRGKLMGGAKALFWLNVLEPLIHPASVPRDEIREILLALLEELKGIDGVYEQLMKKSERIWAILTLPLKLMPLFKGVSTLALRGHEMSAQEAMEILTIFAEEYTAFPNRKQRKLPLGLSVVASVGTFGPLDFSSLSGLPQILRDQLVKPLATMVRDWIGVIEEVLDVLEKSLTAKWTLCERAPFEEELKRSMQSDLQNSFQRLKHALATDQLYAMRKEGREKLSDEDCLNVTILRERGVLLCTIRTRDEEKK